MSIFSALQRGRPALPWKFSLLVFACAAASLRAQDVFDFSSQVRPRPEGIYQVQGKVIDARSGQPMAGAEVSILEGSDGQSPAFEVVESSADGNFRFVRLPEGKYTLRATRQGYVGQALLQHENFWTAVAVGPGKDSLHIRFPLNPSASITGQVLDENGEPARSAAVALWKQDLNEGTKRPNNIESVQTDDEGRYRFGHLTAGQYSVSVSAKPWYHAYLQGGLSADSITTSSPLNLPKSVFAFKKFRSDESSAVDNSANLLPDVVYPTLYYPGVTDVRSVAWMTLPAGESASADFHLQPVLSVHLQVYAGLQPGAPESNRRFALNQERIGGESESVEFTQTAVAPGVVEVSGLPPGHYQLIADSRGNEGDPEHTQELDLPGTGEVKLDAPPIDGPKVHIELRPERGEPLPITTLELKDAAGHTRRTVLQPDAMPDAATSELGNIQLPAGPGVYHLSVPQPAGVVVKKIEVTGAKLNGDRIETDGTSDISVVLTVDNFDIFLDGVAIRNGQHVAGAMILLTPEHHEDWERLVRRDQSDSDGTFRLANIAPGKYTVLALENGWELEWSKPEVREKYLAKALKLEFTDKPRQGVTLEVQ